MTDTDQKQMDEVLRRMLATPPTPHKRTTLPPGRYIIPRGEHGLTTDLSLYKV